MNNAINMVEVMLNNKDRLLINFNMAGNQPLPNEYWTYLDQRNDMIPDLLSHYLQLIGVLR